MLPVAYWMLKMHKSPIGAQLIIANRIFVTKELSQKMAVVSKFFHDHIKNYLSKIISSQESKHFGQCKITNLFGNYH